RDNRSCLRIELHSRSIDIIWSHNGDLHSILLGITSRLHFSQTLRPPVAVAARLRFPFEAILFRSRNGTVLRIDSDTADGQKAIDAGESRPFQYVQIDQCIVKKHLPVMFHVIPQTANLRGKVHHDIPTTTKFIATLRIAQIRVVIFRPPLGLRCNSSWVTARAEIDSSYRCALVKQTINQMRADKTPSAGDHNLFISPEAHNLSGR